MTPNVGVESGLTIPRLKLLMAAYTARRRSEVAQLWQVIRHAQHSEDDNPGAVLPPLPADTAPVDQDDEDSDAFDAVEMVRQHRKRELEREGG